MTSSTINLNSRIQNFVFTVISTALCCLVLVSSSQGASIGINFQGSQGANGLVGANTAGLIPQGNWNDVTGGSPASFPLVDDGGAASGVTVSYSLNLGGGIATSMSAVGDNRMLQGNVWNGSFGNADIVLGGTIPYANYDVYVYYNGNTGTPQTQTFSILSTALSDVAFEDHTISDSAFVETNGVSHGNYVAFLGLDNTTLPNFTLRSVGTSGQYAYFNGIQIVEVPQVPEPSSVVLLGLGLVGLSMRRRKMIKKRSESRLMK